jgi:hypothetical protein
MTFNADMHPTSQQPKRPRTKEDNAARLAVRRHGGACLKHKSTKKKVRFLGNFETVQLIYRQCRCKMPGYRSGLRSAPLVAASPPQLSSASPYSPPGLETDPPKYRSPRQIVSQSLLQLLKGRDMSITPAEPFCERLPKILSAAAKLLKTDFNLSADPWLPVLRVADTIFRSTETLVGQIDISNLNSSLQQRFYHRLSEVILQICIILSEDCPTSLQTMRFLLSLREAIENLLDCLNIDRATEWARTCTLTVWLDITEREINTLRLLLPEDTPVFTCPFPLAGCTYQTTDMQQWILHKDQCDKQRSISRSARTSKKAGNELLDSPYRIHTEAKVFRVLRFIICLLLLLVQTDSFQPHSGLFKGAPPQVDRRQRFKIYRIVWLKSLRLFVVWLDSLRLFGLCMLSVLPACTNMLGFVVCWLTILRSINTWKCTGDLCC